MPISRSRAQQLGARGERLVAHLIEQQGEWITRFQEQDFGVDLEIEFASSEVTGQLVKLQIKTSQRVTRSETAITKRIPRSLLEYAATCRIPVLVVVVELETGEAWFVWLQEWLVQLRRIGKRLAALPKTVQVQIPLSATLSAGLASEFKSIASWKTETQVLLSLLDTIRTALATRLDQIIFPLVEVIDAIDQQHRDFPIDLIVDEVIDSGPAIWGGSDGFRLSSVLYAFCQRFGDRFTTAHVTRLVWRGDMYSRTGINALGFLYDTFPEYIARLELASLFEKYDDPRPAYYCKLREEFVGLTLSQILLTADTLSVDGLDVQGVDRMSILSKWANRGDSAILDFIEPVYGW